MTDEQQQIALAKMKLLIEDPPADEVLVQIIADAEAWALAYTGRSYVPDQLLLNTIGDLAVIEYNRLGTQGESARSEGGESYSFETAPANVITVLNRYRLARTGGKYHETAEEEQA